jgi:ketosteroid isomerase-like protein
MGADENVAVVRRLASAYAVVDIDAINDLLSDDVVFHVPGRHPLSGTYTGKTEVFGYLAQVAGASQSEDGGFEIHSVMGDDDHVVALVSGTIENGGVRFVRPTVHVFHVNGEQITEFWEASLDQHTEDEFWNNAIG